MKLRELVPIVQRGSTVQDLPSTTAGNCPQGFLLNVNGMSPKEFKHTILGSMPEYGEFEVVNLVQPPPPVQPKTTPKKTAKPKSKVVKKRAK